MILKKPKFWDYNEPNFYAYILFPITVIIKVINSLTRKLNKVSSNNSKIKTVCVGNFYVGGTGKTSLCLEINKILRTKNIKSFFIKKAYKDQIDEQQLFYLSTRGFNEEQARAALIAAFLNTPLSDMGSQQLHTWLIQRIEKHLNLI